MALLNLKSFLKQCEKRLVYYDHPNYHLFTNGVIMYGIAKGTQAERPDMYLSELLEKVIYNVSALNLKTFDSVVIAYHQSQREYVVDYEKQAQTTKAKNKVGKEDRTDNTKEVTLDNKLLRCCKAKPATGKQAFICLVNFKTKSLTCYFVTSLLGDEFIFIMPIIKNFKKVLQNT